MDALLRPDPSPLVALVGNPNCGKTALFNVLTGSRQKVANYAGVTIERKEGTLQTPSGRRVRILDLPGAYSLDPLTPDEQVTADVLLGRRAGESAPDFVVCVTDATNLRQNLRLALSLKRLGLPMVVALNMADIARRKGTLIDARKLEHELGVPVVETVGVKSSGAKALVRAARLLGVASAARTARRLAHAHPHGSRSRPGGGAPHPRHRGRRSSRFRHRQRQTRCRGAAPSGGSLDTCRDSFPGVPGRFRLGTGPHGCDQGRCRAPSPAGSAARCRRVCSKACWWTACSPALAACSSFCRRSSFCFFSSWCSRIQATSRAPHFCSTA